MKSKVMYRLLAIILLAFAVGAGQLSASQAHTYADALKRAGKNRPVVLFCYGANYDKYSEKIYEEYVKNRRGALAKVLNKAIYVVVPIYQRPNDKEKREYERALGGKGLPGGIWSYPSFTIVDGSGRVRGAVRSSEELSDPEKTAEALNTLLEAFQEQDKLLDRAEKATGPNKARLMHDAVNVDGMRMPGYQECDPANDGLVQELQTKGVAEANNIVRSKINSGNYSKLGRQMILSAYAGRVRQLMNKGQAPVHLLRAIYTEMRNIDPKSTYGVYAEGAIELWVVPREVDTKAKGKAKPADGQAPAEDKEAPKAS